MRPALSRLALPLLVLALLPLRCARWIFKFKIRVAVVSRLEHFWLRKMSEASILYLRFSERRIKISPALFQSVECETRPYFERVGSGRRKAGRQGEAGPGKTERRRISSPTKQPSVVLSKVSNTCLERHFRSTNKRNHTYVNTTTRLTTGY